MYQVWLFIEFRGELIAYDQVCSFDALDDAIKWCSGKDYFFIRVYDDVFDYMNYVELDCFGDLV